MKILIISLMTLSISRNLMAKQLNLADGEFNNSMTDLISETNYNQDMKVTYLTKMLELQQKSYDDRIAFLENELGKTKERLIEKSLNQEKIEEAMIVKYSAEAIFYKRELAYKTKSLLEYQRQIEKMKPTDDLKNMIKLNTELASDLRKSEDQIAFIQLKHVESIQGKGSSSRLPASVKDKR